MGEWAELKMATGELVIGVMKRIVHWPPLSLPSL